MMSREKQRIEIPILAFLPTNGLGLKVMKDLSLVGLESKNFIGINGLKKKQFFATHLLFVKSNVPFFTDQKFRLYCQQASITTWGCCLVAERSICFVD